MGVYRRYVLPGLLHVAMKSREVARQRARVVPAARGRVLEVGVGSGLNLPFYGPGVEAVVGLDPSRPLLAMAKKQAAKARPGLPFAIEWVDRPAEDMPFEGGSFDTVLSTWTLCSIGEPLAALAEMRRVLRPGGALIFMEHGRAPDARVRRWQDRLNPLWRRCAGGCNLDRRIDRLIEEAGFRMVRLETGYMMKGPKTHTFHYRGLAERD